MLSQSLMLASPINRAVSARHLQVGGLYWVATSRENVSPSLVLELLMRIHSICRDYFGYVSEEVGAGLRGACWRLSQQSSQAGARFPQSGMARGAQDLLPPRQQLAALPPACHAGGPTWPAGQSAPPLRFFKPHSASSSAPPTPTPTPSPTSPPRSSAATSCWSTSCWTRSSTTASHKTPPPSGSSSLC